MISRSKVVVVDHPVGWAGIPYYFLKELKLMVDQVIILGDVSPAERINAAARLANYRSSGRRYIPDRDVELLHYRSERMRERLAVHSDADAIIVFHPPDAAFLDTRIPIFIVHDATWRQFTDTYPGWSKSDLLEDSYLSGFSTERTAFAKAKCLIFLTNWAADSARNEYPELRDKIRVVPPGANLPDEPAPSSIENALECRLKEPCQLLFVGYDTYRKGLDIAMEVTDCLRAKSIPAVLHVVGNAGREESLTVKTNNVRLHGRLDKTDRMSWSLLSQLYLESFVFLFPSKAECAGIVLCEAAAFGLPAVVPQVGGMPDIVLHGTTGYIVDAITSPEKYADVIGKIWSDPVLYRTLSKNARERYNQILNWKQSIIKIINIIYNCATSCDCPA